MELKEQLEALTLKLEGKSQTEVKNAIGAFEVKNKEAIELAVKEVKDTLGAELKAIQDHADALDVKLKAKNTKNITVSLADELKEKKADIKSVSNGTNSGEIEVKAITNLGSVTNNAQGFFIPEITQLGYKERSLYNVLPKVGVSDSNTGGLVRYRDWDAATTVRAAAMIAESGTFPESTAKFEWYSKSLKKVGDTLAVTEEFWEDEAQAAAELTMFLDINVNLVVDGQIVNGDNTGQNLDGIYNSTPAYTASASGISAPNLKDLAIKVRNDITRAQGGKYSPDFLLVNSLTMESLILAKDANNNYIFDESTGTLGGLNVVVDENVADNSILVGDRRYARIYEKTGVVITRGTPNAQFLEDEMTIKARKRMLLLVKNGDKSGFRKVTDVAAALVTLAS